MASSWTIKQLFNVADMHNIGTFVFTCLLLYVGIGCTSIGTISMSFSWQNSLRNVVPNSMYWWTSSIQKRLSLLALMIALIDAKKWDEMTASGELKMKMDRQLVALVLVGWRYASMSLENWARCWTDFNRSSWYVIIFGDWSWSSLLHWSAPNACVFPTQW